MSDFSDVLTALSSGADNKGKAFERALKWWLGQDPTWSKVFSPNDIHLWDDSPYRNGPDVGIDLTAVDRFGKVWAIQAKNWDPSFSLPKSEIDSFLSASSTSVYSSRLLVTTTRNISANARRTIHEQEKPCVVITYDSLEESSVWSSFFQDTKIQVKTPVQPLFEYQEEAVSKVVSAFGDGVTKGQLIMACGTGKTMVAQAISNRLGAHKILVLVPSLLLVQQTLQSWLRNAPSSLTFLAVCSDDSVANDSPRDHTSDLPFAVTTDTEDIASFLELSGSSVIFSTYQSSHRVAEAQATCQTEFDLVIADEAHRLAGLTSSDYSTVLDSNKIRSRLKLFMTATPRIYSSVVSAKAAEADIEVASMDDEKIFGHILHSYSFARAIEEQRLMDYEVVVFGVSDSELNNELDERRLAELDGLPMDAKLLGAHVGLARAMEKYKIHRVISFHSRVSAARKFASAHPVIRNKALSDSLDHELSLSKVLTGEDSAHFRKRVLSELVHIKEGSFGLVTNSRCLTEGVDVPSLDGVAFIDPRASQVDIVQALGRAIRRSGPNKLKGYIVVPIFLSLEEMEAGEINRSNFKHVFDVLNGIKAHDEAFTQQVTDIRTELGRSGTIGEGLPKLSLDLPKRVNSDFFSKIEVMLLRNITASWDEWYGKLLAHLEQSGSLRINHSSTRSDEDKALSGWVTKQRGSYKAGRLSTERSRKLEQLQGWTWDPFEDSWWESFDELVDFSKTHGHCRVQKLDDGDLYSWMSRQRNDRTNLTTQKTDALEALPGWTWDPLEAQWRANYDALAQLASETGSSQLPAKFEYKGIKIGQWIGWMRKKYAQSSLPASQIQMLERLPGWTWDSLESAWQEMFSLTKELSETTGLGKVEKRSSYKGKKVGQWIGVQRRARASMTASRKSQLESLAGWTWDPKEHQWNQNYQLLSQLVAEQGFESIQTNEVVNGVKIGQWIGVQRRHRNEISEERRNALEALPGWTWSPIQDKRVRVIKALKDFYESNGHLDIPASTKVDGINLYAYASRLRRSKDKLEQSEREALETIGAWRWSDSPTSTA